MRAVSALLIVLGLLQGAQGGWIYAKAWLAGVMLEGAWTRTLEGESQVTPWPWADTWPVARLSFPDHGLSMVVLEGASGRVLAFAPGHLHGTACPGGEGACVVAGHRDTDFAILERLEPGDRIDVEVSSGLTHRYRVRECAVLDRNDMWALTPTESPELILITCWPFDAVVPGGPERYVVWADEAPAPTFSPVLEAPRARRSKINGHGAAVSLDDQPRECPALVRRRSPSSA